MGCASHIKKQITVSGRRLFNLTTIMTVMEMGGAGTRVRKLAHMELRRNPKVRFKNGRTWLSEIPDQCPQRSWSTLGFLLKYYIFYEHDARNPQPHAMHTTLSGVKLHIHKIVNRHCLASIFL
jgi:hypothetical protein